MAKISVTVRDINLIDGTFRTEFAAEGSQLDEGRATAAYFTGFYLYTVSATPEFADGVVGYARRLMDAMHERGVTDKTRELASAVLTISDINYETGQIDVNLTMAGGDAAGESLPTTAQVIGGYMRNLVGDMSFRTQCLAFAEEFCANNDGTIINRAVFENDDNQAATAA